MKTNNIEYNKIEMQKQQERIRIGNKIKELREALKMTQEDLAEKTGYTSNNKKSSICKIESGENGIPRSKLLLFAKALNTTVDDLMNWNTTAIVDIHSIQIQTNSVPILGKVACGEPIYAPETANVYTTTDSKLNVDFALIATGDSMIDAGISDGDIVLIKQQPNVETGEIAAVSINDEVTLKRVYYYPEANKLVLQPANPNYPPMIYLEAELSNVHILGKAIAVQHLL